MRVPRRRFAGAERVSRVSQSGLKLRCARMRATKDAPSGPFHVLEHRQGLAEIVGRGGWVLVERQRVNFPKTERYRIIIAEDASRHGHHFAKQCLDFSEAL